MLSDALLQELRASIRGQLIVPTDSHYDDARKVHNAMIDKRPAVIIRCAGVADVVAPVLFARKNNLDASVRAGGHRSGLSVSEDPDRAPPRIRIRPPNSAAEVHTSQMDRIRT